MGRKSLAEERTNQILDAFERCIIHYGLDGATLEQIAAEANVRRSIIRHYIGNRDALVAALIERIMSDYQQQLEELFALTSGEQWVTIWLTALFDDISEEDVRRDKILDQILSKTDGQYTQARQTFATIYDALVTRLAEGLQRLYPQKSLAVCREVVFSVLALAEAANSVPFMGLDETYREMAKQSALRLVDYLKSE